MDNNQFDLALGAKQLDDTGQSGFTPHSPLHIRPPLPTSHHDAQSNNRIVKLLTMDDEECPPGW